jgi:hypothetical protein
MLNVTFPVGVINRPALHDVLRSIDERYVLLHMNRAEVV